MAHRPPTDPAVRLDPRAVAEAFAHPLRGKILVALSERPDITIGEVAERLGESPRRVRHHIEAILDQGLAEVTGEESRGGVIQRRYGTGRLIVDGGDSLSDEKVVEVAKATARLLMEDIGVAARADTQGRRADDLEARMYGEVDDACLEELVDLHWRAYHDIFRAFEEGRERVRQSGRPGTEVVSALFFFEAPLWGRSTRARPDRGPTRPRSAAAPPDGRGCHSPLHGADDPDPQAMAEAYRHPVRGRVLTALSERPDVTVREVAERLGEPPRRVRHHLEALLGTGLVRVTGSEKLSGVIQHRYGAGPLVVDDSDSWSREERVRTARFVVRLLAVDLAVAAAAGTLGKGRDDFQVRMYGEVDDDCLARLGALHERAYRSIRTAIDEGRDRNTSTGGPGTEVVSALYHFEAPVWGDVVAHR
ncbi:MAG TPA: helix-turn-helix domain-containing protein [Solirubrobacterales bacterium]|jgi:DNA-binding transcriptional ArsR family regulator